MSKLCNWSGFFLLMPLHLAPQAAEVTEQSHFPLTTDSGIPEYPVLPVDPVDLQVETISSQYKQHLVKLGPYQPCLVSYPTHKDNEQSRSLKVKWFSLPFCKNGWNILARQIKCIIFHEGCLVYYIPTKERTTGYHFGVTGYSKNSVKHICVHACTRYHIASMVALKKYLQGIPIDIQLNQQRVEKFS